MSIRNNISDVVFDLDTSLHRYLKKIESKARHGRVYTSDITPIKLDALQLMTQIMTFTFPMDHPVHKQIELILELYDVVWIVPGYLMQTWVSLG